MKVNVKTTVRVVLDVEVSAVVEGTTTFEDAAKRAVDEAENKAQCQFDPTKGFRVQRAEAHAINAWVDTSTEPE